MGTVKICFWLVCFAFIGRGWCIDSYFIRKEKKNGKGLIAIARSQIGIREQGAENSGVAVARYLDYVGIQSPAPWCAAWLSWCFKEAGYSAPKTAWSPALFPKSLLVTEAKPGIVYGLYFASLKRIGHCGLVELRRNDWIYGIEGNTNFVGNREGDGVYRRIRHMKTIYRFADWLTGKSDYAHGF